MKLLAAVAVATLALATPAHAADAQSVYRQISTDVTCTSTHCSTLAGWRELAAQACDRFQTPNAPQDQSAVTSCAEAQLGLQYALVKANSYGRGLFTDHSEPTLFHDLNTPAPASVPPAKAPVGKALLRADDLPQYKFAREAERSRIAGGSPETRYFTIVFGMIKAHLHKTPELHVDRATKPGAVDFHVDTRGNLVGRKLASSSGSPNLDTAVMTAVAAAAPYPAPPSSRARNLRYNFGRR